MDYLIKSFLNVLKNHRIKFKIYNRSKSFIIDLYNIPEDLEQELIECEYERFIKQEYSKNENGDRDYINTYENIKCIGQIIDCDDERCLRIFLDNTTYAKKISLIDYTIREYVYRKMKMCINI